MKSPLLLCGPVVALLIASVVALSAPAGRGDVPAAERMAVERAALEDLAPVAGHVSGWRVARAGSETILCGTMKTDAAFVPVEARVTRMSDADMTASAHLGRSANCR